MDGHGRPLCARRRGRGCRGICLSLSESVPLSIPLFPLFPPSVLSDVPPFLSLASQLLSTTPTTTAYMCCGRNDAIAVVAIENRGSGRVSAADDTSLSTHPQILRSSFHPSSSSFFKRPPLPPFILLLPLPPFTLRRRAMRLMRSANPEGSPSL